MPITVVVDGCALPAVTQIVSQGGILLAPFTGVIDRIVTQAAMRSDGTLELRRGSRVVFLRMGARLANGSNGSFILPVAPQKTPGNVLLPLAAVARALGESVAFDVARQTVSLSMPTDLHISPMSPLPRHAVNVAPTVIFTPEPPKTPVPIVTPPVRPRRTPISVPLDPARAPV